MITGTNGKFIRNDVEISRGVETLEIMIINWNDQEVEYIVKNTPICQWDQHSRARLGVEFFDYKVSEKPEYIFYTNVFDKMAKDPYFREDVLITLNELEQIRNTIEFKTDFNLMSRSCSYRVKQTMDSLKGQMVRRLKMCEEEFIVAVHMKLRDTLIKLGCKMAETFLPGCDLLQKCDYSSADYLSNMFGCLFTGCNRWPGQTEFATFNFSCSTRKDLEQQLCIKFPKSEYEIKNNIK